MKFTDQPKPTLLLYFLFFITTVQAQNPLLVNAYNREATSLNGYWRYIVDPYDNGYYNYRYEAFDQQAEPSKNAFFMNAKRQDPSELLEYNFDRMDSLQVPGDWNSQKEKLFYYEGSVWYKKSFDVSAMKANARYYLYFGASNYQTEVYLNGKKLGKHIGGFTPFNFEVTGLVKEKENALVVLVNNQRKKEGVPTLNTDWWNYGGLTRGVKLIELPSTFIEDFRFQLAQGSPNLVRGHLRLNGAKRAGAKVEISLDELDLKLAVETDADGFASFEIPIEKLDYWSPENPKRYLVKVQSEEDLMIDQIGLRRITTEGKEILLNGKPIFLRGISIHEESPLREGRAHSIDDARQLLAWAKELGCNYVRLAHYPHNEHMVRLAEEMGLMVWAENPVYWTIAWENEQTYQNAEHQLAELIRRDANRASVIIWSMSNETPTSKPRFQFLERLAHFARSQDQTRLISAALEQSNFEGNPNIRTIEDPFAQVVDVLSFNQYIGWYDGLPEKCEQISWKIDLDKPVLISEFGAGAKKGLYGDKTERWTEEYQEELYVKTLQMLSKIDQLRGMSPWILVDFRSPRRVLPEIQDGWNRKGLISEQGEKKKAFSVLANYYQGIQNGGK